MKKAILCCLAAVLLCAALSACAEVEVCSTPEEFVLYLRELSLTQPPLTNMTFQVPCTEDLVRLLNKDMEYLHQLERDGGLVDVHYGYPYHDRIDYRNCQFDDYLPIIRSWDDFDEMMDSLPDSLDSQIYFYVDSSVRDELTWDAMMERIYLGFYPCKLETRYSGIFMTIRCNVVYSDGAQILHAFRTRNRSELADDELKAAYDIAVGIVSGLKGLTSKDKARELHDILCRRVTYGPAMGKAKHQGAVSALKYGQCVCYGYADTYYLLCNMAGIRCTYQVGWTSSNKPALKTKQDFYDDPATTHAWNLVFVNGRWTMVDVTWDDRESGIDHRYFLLASGRSKQPRTSILFTVYSFFIICYQRSF